MSARSDGRTPPIAVHTPGRQTAALAGVPHRPQHGPSPHQDRHAPPSTARSNLTTVGTTPRFPSHAPNTKRARKPTTDPHNCLKDLFLSRPPRDRACCLSAADVMQAFNCKVLACLVGT